MPLLCSQVVMGSKYRAKLRKKFNLVEAPYGDCFSHVFCSCCSLCQEFRELQSRGLDPNLGWNELFAQQAMQQGYPDQVQHPPHNQTMSKTSCAAKLRKRFNLVEASYEDFFSHVFFPCCSLCQEFRELQRKGLDPNLGMSFMIFSLDLLIIFTTPT
ncbi:hypothetical protein IFM89_016008 [Coptis chinensis]|uniref:Uncharacterized protein n=1 Tax=Coptis chinensis TaxID=261450 RepID=A0A835M0B8_9MAGN|nr:hypothetical protein IFM89_016008 [Coptis chinensis]